MDAEPCSGRTEAGCVCVCRTCSQKLKRPIVQRRMNALWKHTYQNKATFERVFFGGTQSEFGIDPWNTFPRR